MKSETAGEGRDDQAVAWFVRLQDCDDEDAWIAHRDWLEADAGNARAYAAVEMAWIDAEGLDAHTAQPATLATTERETAQVFDLSARRTAMQHRRTLWWIPAAAAAAVVAMVAGPRIGDLFDEPGTTYRTDAASGREIALADGSRLTLDRSTEATVRIDVTARTVTLASGQAAFDVRHDADRPFTIAAAGREVRVLGTAFDVLARDGAFGVSVRRGLVSVSQAGGTVRLPAGKALLRLPDSDRDRIGDVDPKNAFAWKEGRLVYLDSDLTTVAHDYERYIGKRVTVAPDVAKLHISGVVRARDEDDLIRQLEALLPIRIIKSASGREIRKS